MSGKNISKIPSGTIGLDEVLHGGVPESHTTLINGGPGTGKTVLALQFLAEGNNGLYVGFEEREKEIRRNAETLGIDHTNIEILDLSPNGEEFFSNDSYTVFPTEEVDGEDLLSEIASELQSSDIDRLVIDPLSELRSLLPGEFQFRRKISSLFNALTDRGVTTVCVSQPPEAPADDDLQFLGNTVLDLQRTTDRRTLEVTKYRGSGFASGIHTFRIQSGTGGRVYSKLVPGEHHQNHERTQLPSDISKLDELLHGGIERGSVTVISGPSGVGKTTTGSQFLQSAANRGQRGLVCLFEELRSDYLYRAAKLSTSQSRLVETSACRRCV